MITIELTDDDAAFVFKSTGTEVYLPNEANTDGSDIAPDHVLLAGMVCLLLGETAFAHSIRAILIAHMKAVMGETR
jgi:hypothetical protein